MKLRLFDWKPSPFCIKVRALLDHKGLDYERVPVLGRPLVELRSRGGIGKVPALEIDGELICDSTEIAHALEQLTPEPAVIPSDPRDRARCHVLEDWCDEALYFQGLYLHWRDPEGRRQTPRAFGRSPMGRAAFAIYASSIHLQLRGQGVGRKPRELICRDIERNLRAIDRMLSGGDYLIDEWPRLCDFALIGQLVYLGMSPLGRRLLEQHEHIGAYMSRMRKLRRHH
jgi:glutathione S-transferase